MTSGIARDEWLSALQDALTVQQGDGAGSTVEEIANSLNMSDHRKIRAKLKVLLASGQAEAGWGKRQQINGVWRLLPVYRLKKALLQ